MRNDKKFNEKQRRQIRHWKKKTKVLSLYKKIEILDYAAKGYTNQEISNLTGYTIRRISALINEYLKNGIYYFLEEHRKGGNRRNLTDKQEENILEKFNEKAEKGQVVSLNELKKEYEQIRGKETANSTFYDFLNRNNWRRVMPRGAHPKKASEEAVQASKKKINLRLDGMNSHILPFAEKDAKIRLFFMDEAGFGRISEPSYCWCPEGVRPIVPCHRVREYVYAFGAVDPIEGDKCFIIAPQCNTAWTNEFLKVLSKEYKNDYILLCTDNASWHKSQALDIPENIIIHYLPPYTPEMNPIEQIWKEIRKDGFKNTLFNSLKDVIDKLSDSLMSLSNVLIKSVCARDWIIEISNRN